MIKSMTGYGKKTKTINNKKISVEIKTLNSKNINPIIKIPETYNNKEIEIRKKITEKLKGGKINFILTIEETNPENTNLDTETINRYYKTLSKIAEKNNLNPDKQLIFQAVLKLPNIFKPEQNQENENEWKMIVNLIDETMKDVDKFRKQEGKSLEKDLSENIKQIEKLIPEIEKYEDERISTVKERLKTKLNEFLEGEKQNKERFEQEIIYFLDKFDINEEKIRLKNHCKYFLETMKNKQPVGNKLGFISQEIGREINTLGSKANHSEIQKTVVNMKDYLGKIKEQSLNVL